MALFAVALAVLMVAARPRAAGVASATPSESPATVTAEVAELRRDASTHAEAIERLPRGARVTVVADRGRWLEVATAGKETGFVLQETVETDADRDSRKRRASKVLSFPAVSGVVAEDTDVLLAPFPLAARAGSLRKGETIPIHAVDHDYYLFRANDGSLAFARSADIDLVPPDPRRPAILPETGRVPNIKVSDVAPEETPGPSGEASEPEVESSVRAAAEQEPAVLVSKVEPEYPEIARRAGVEGAVVIDATIDETGRVTDAEVLRGLPLGVSEAAVKAVLHWKYRPARGGSGPVASRKTIRVVFKLGH